ncbi:hypothetical protein [Streptomyces regalis]|uniref:Membrane-bound hydrophilic protein n=1 Tax=Streptomyces regalis TaxID=68262 RepID=A0A101J633_9ACTN|nr:hypothetical protein [Streptomyces regalis]KUL20912.1 hypothetical protein ADL12_47140 [Streptomyces regalis]
MPADEVTHGADVEASRVRTGPRHAAPKKPLFTRFHMPAGKAIAIAAMPTAVLMGLGFTSSLALADSDSSSSPTLNSLTADEYKACVAALDDSKDASASPSPSESTYSGKDDEAEPTPSASASGQDSSGSSNSSGDSGSSDSSGSGDGSSSSDSGSDDGAEPTPTPSASKTSEAQSGDTTTPSPSASESGGNLLEDIGDAITGIFTGGSGSSDTASPTPSASPSASEDTSSDSSDSSAKDTSDASDTVKETTDKVTDTVKDTVKGTTDTASKAAEDTTKTVEKAAEDAAGAATALPSPSASSSTDAEDCVAATDDEGGVDNKQFVADDPWYLEASSLTLKGADYQGIVEVKTASGTTKKVLKYVISDGTDIGDLHQIVKDKQSGKTYHVQAAKGSTSTIRDGKTVMYTESISGNLLGLIPITFDPEHPPPLNIPFIYFTNVKVVQAAQFGGTLTVPGLHSYQSD